MNAYEADLFRDKQIGFFIYLGVEAIMFLTLFATYLIFTPATEGPHPKEIFDVKTVVLSSIFLLSSSGTLIVAEKGLRGENWRKVLPWLGVTLLFGLIFLGFEINEFRGFVADGYGITASSFLSAYYVLVGLHAAHVLFGCGWMIVLFIHAFGKRIPMALYEEKFKIFSYYWHFVDGVWVFIILIVYARYLI
jgi:cytochrome c oxidase subunit 3/cytochrome aa3-600 menaquinol oxidase subunit 3